MFKLRNFLTSLYRQESLIEDVRKEVAKEYGIDPKNLRCRIRIIPLPIIYFTKKIGDKVYHAVGKILGAYNWLRNEICIDALLYFKSKFSPSALRMYVRTLAEEFSHRAQACLGKLRPRRFWDYLQNYASDENEREAKSVAERVASKVLGKYTY